MLRFRPRVFSLPEPGDAGRWLAALRGSHPGLVALDSAGGRPRRWSVVGFDPLRDRGGRVLAPPPTLVGLRGFLSLLAPAGGAAVPGPFHGGFLGALAYDLGAAGERAVRVAPVPGPLVIGGLYTDFVVIDERARRAWLVLGDEPGDGRPPVAARRSAVLAAWSRGGAALVGPRPLGPLVRHVPSAEYQRRIERARARIGAGEIYQANLAHRFTRAMEGDPVALYRRLRDVNPAPYMGYLEWGSHGAPGGALLSASPELLVECDGARARTRPIKGTAPRSTAPLRDAALARGLLDSEKDRAELAMIVDLERNDLGRVARPGTVRVGGFPTLESYATVHHLVADVTAELAPGRDAVDVLAALFPGGSITGAPKLASMDVIAELEGEGRGFFTGSLGLLDTRGRAAFNILIRTLVWRPTTAGGQRGEVGFHVGGGITWGSDPAAEDRETLAKGAALLAALEGVPAPALQPTGAV